MMRSLSSAVAGLRAHQTKMDVIGNNISNVNTYGFKASRMTFSDVYYQNLTGSKSGVTGSSAGKNPTQIGYGAAVATIDVMNNVTGAATTDRALDVYITGEGFLVSKDAGGKIAYTRLGNLGFDAAGNLVDGGGNLVQGFPIKQDGSPDISADGTIIADQLTSINVDPKILEKLTGISISSSGAIVGMLEGDPTVSPKATNPSWINNNTMTVPSTSVYNGPVRLAMSGFTDNLSMERALGLPAGSIGSIEMGTMALPAGGNYSISVDKNGNVTMSRPADTNATPPEEAVSLTGAIKNGQLVLANKKGDVGLTINIVDKSIVTVPTTIVPAGTTVTEVDYSMTSANGYVEYYTDSSGGTDPFYPYVRNVDASDPNADLTMPIFEPEYVTDVDSSQTADPGYYAMLDASGNQDSAHPYVRPVPAGPDADLTRPIHVSGYVSGDYDFQLGPTPGYYEFLDASGVQVDPSHPYVMPVDENDPSSSGVPIYEADGSGGWKQLEIGGVKQCAALNPSYVPLKIGGVDQYAATITTPTGNYNQLVVGTQLQYAASTKTTYATDTDVPATLALELYYQMKTTDKGGNTVIFPATPQKYSDIEPATSAGYPITLQLGELSFQISEKPYNAGFNADIATAGPGEETAYMIGNLVLAKFQNTSGLQQSGSSYFVETANSGTPEFVMPGLEGTGALKAGYLEMSSVDVSKEFTDMITTQRGFQANSRIITVSDEMLQELVNLKR